MGRVLGAQHTCHHERFAPERTAAAAAATTAFFTSGLILEWAAAIHKVDPKLKLGGPVFEGVNEDITVWPDAQGRKSDRAAELT
jgi:hypothetical protein